MWLWAWLRKAVNAWSISKPALSGLLDDDAAVEGVLAQLVDDLGLERSALLEDGDGTDIGQGLGGTDIGTWHFAGLGVVVDSRSAPLPTRGHDGEARASSGCVARVGRRAARALTTIRAGRRSRCLKHRSLCLYPTGP